MTAQQHTFARLRLVIQRQCCKRVKIKLAGHIKDSIATLQVQLLPHTGLQGTNSNLWLCMFALCPHTVDVLHSFFHMEINSNLLLHIKDSEASFPKK